MLELNAPLQHALDSHAAEPLQMVDPRTNKAYVLIPTEIYEKMRAALEDKLDIRDAYPLLDEMAGKAGWDDPAMDIYNDFAPKNA